MDHFVNEDSIVRKIWGKGDTVLFIFAGSAAEFALNKAVDWLYFTGRLPADPLGRLFSTVSYSRRILFSELDDALQAIDKITAIHKNVEQSRAARIPDEAYRDVLFMLIDYSIRSFELLERKLTTPEKEEVFDVFFRMGRRMGLNGLPENYIKWLTMRAQHLNDNLVHGHFTMDLYKQYRKHLGFARYTLLLQVQIMLVPAIVKKKLALGNSSWVVPALYLYKLLRSFKLEALIRDALLPPQYRAQVQRLNVYEF